MGAAPGPFPVNLEYVDTWVRINGALRKIGGPGIMAGLQAIVASKLVGPTTTDDFGLFQS